MFGVLFTQIWDSTFSHHRNRWIFLIFFIIYLDNIYFNLIGTATANARRRLQLAFHNLCDVLASRGVSWFTRILCGGRQLYVWSLWYSFSHIYSIEMFVFIFLCVVNLPHFKVCATLGVEAWKSISNFPSLNWALLVSGGKIVKNNKIPFSLHSNNKHIKHSNNNPFNNLFDQASSFSFPFSN